MQDKHFTFLKNPGYIRDLLYIFSIKFCEPFIYSETKEFDNKTSAQQKDDNIYNKFGEISQKLYLFFNVDCKSPCFLIQEYFIPWVLNTPDSLSFDTFYQQLKDQKQFEQRLFHYYFPELDIDRALSDGTEFNDIILESNLPDRVQLYLYHYFHKSKQIHQLLLDELKNKELLLQAYYSQHRSEIEAFIHHFNPSSFQTVYLNLHPSERDLFQKEKQYYTLSLLCEYFTAQFSTEQHTIFLLGFNSKLALEHMIFNKIDLQQVYQCLSNQNRYKIVAHLWKYNTITVTEIQHLLQIKPPAISELVKELMNAQLIKCEKQGKSHIYRLNDAYINTVSDYIDYLVKSRKELL